MDRLTRFLAGLLGRAARLLPGWRRDWAEAALAESGEVPAGARRAMWLGGGLLLVAREILTRGGLRILAFAAGAAGVRVVQLAGSLLELRRDAEPDVDGRHSADPGRAAAGDPPPVRAGARRLGRAGHYRLRGAPPPGPVRQ
jgi:hypothetical protein